MLRRVSASLVVLLVASHWSGVLSTWPGQGRGFAAFLAVLAAIAVAGIVYAAARVTTRRLDLGSAAAIAFALVGAAGPLLLNGWIRGDYDRYLWVIRQQFPCSTMGSGPGMLSVIGTSWLAAAAGVLYAAPMERTARARSGAAGLAAGAIVLALLAGAMFPDPAVFATLLGCR